MKLPFISPIITHKPPEAYTMSILGSYSQTQSWIISNYINFFMSRSGKGDFWGKDFFYQDCPWLFESHIPREIIKKSIPDFISFCKTSLCSGFYLSFMINEKWIPAYNQERDFDHNILIYGYEEADKIFYIADFFSNRKYNFASCTYRELENAFFDEYIDHTDYFETVRLINFRNTNYIFEPDIVKENLKDHLSSTNLFTKYRRRPYEESLQLVGNQMYSYMSEQDLETQYYFGLDYYEQLKTLFLQEKFYDVRPFHLLYDRMKLMKVRIEFLEKYGLLTVDQKIHEMSEACINSSLICRNMIIKQNLTSKETKNSSRIAEYLTCMCEQDRVLCEMILEKWRD